ncbi:hypothetical protein ANCDUO_15145 [Ancylostoma duodenale]|uniref:Uncharacterized protein n=1 Tax=Ancylostoma duodenale TaxID=51022 RepID=A0A0C2GCF9_9BILA|nr:hypothetical protein ANCDUO_15145 [Ancylostoma duodenale]
MANGSKPDIIRWRRAVWASYNTIKPVVFGFKNKKLRTELFDSTVIPTLCYGTETWTLTKIMEAQVKTTHSLTERYDWLHVAKTRCEVLHYSNIRSFFKVTDTLKYANHSKQSWAEHVMRRNGA